MPSIVFLRAFLNQKLNSTVEEILEVFEKAIYEYQNEIEHQRRLLEDARKSSDKPQKTEHQELTRSLHREEEEEPLVKEEMCPEEVEIKHEINSIIVTTVAEEIKDEDDPMLDLSADEAEFVEHQDYMKSLYDDDDDDDDDEEEEEEPLVKEETCPEDMEVKQEIDCILVTTEASKKKEDLTLHSSADETENVEENVGEFMSPSTHYIVPPDDANMDGPSQSKTNYVKRKYRKNQDPLKCSFCGKTFSCMSKLKSHTRTHTGERPFKCPTCGKGFAFGDNLKNHLMTHTGEKPFPCVTCGRFFSCRRNLREHMRTHTGEKPYLCNLCGKTFSHLSTMVKHKNLHLDNNPYSCDTCGAGFDSQTNLTAHKSTHTGEKPYVCGVCGKRFKQKSTCSKHERTHLEKSLPCLTCGKDFKSEKDLNSHMRIHQDDLVITVDS